MENSNMSKLFLSELEKSTRSGCWSYDVVTDEIFWSQETYRIHAVEESVKPTVADGVNYYHSEDRDTIEVAFKECITHGKEFRLKLRIINTKGKTVFVEAYGKPIFENGEIAKVFGTFKDISMEVFLLSQRKENSLMYEGLLDSVNLFFITAETDERGVITFVNDKFCQISGYSENELIGKDHRILNSDTHDKDFFSELWETIQNGNSWQGVICNKKKNGDLYWVQTFIFPRFSNGEKVGFSALRYDVTESHLLSEELAHERKNAELSAQLAAVGEISAGIAHEINNPLTIILGKIGLLKSKALDTDKVKEIASSVEKSANRIVKIVKGLHHLAQKSRGGEHSTQDLISIINYTFDFCEEALRSNYIEIVRDFEDDGLLISCDEIKISQVLLNLINNARDSIVESKVQEKRITIKVVRVGSYVEVYVYDSGPGVKEELREKILESFYTTKELGKGTGLGLSLVTRFLAEHDGKLDIVSDSTGNGFMFKLPLKE
jgi:PAS domain S-box-containing protein